MRYFSSCWIAAVAVCGLLMLVISAGVVPATMIEDFDGGGTVPYNLTNSTGSAASIAGPSLTGNYGRLTNLNGSNNNSIAFNEDPSQTGPAPYGVRLAFDFRMTDNAANAGAGGCCGSAADGLGIGMFATAAYGTTGGNNPAAAGGNWERPAFANAFAVGLDIFENIDVVSLNWNGTEVATADVESFLDLNNNIFHRAIVEVTPDGSNALVNMRILEDVHGNTVSHAIFTNQPVAGLNLSALPGYRVIAGGRTGGAFVAGDMDNISLSSLPVPEPSAIVLVVLGGFTLLVVRRRAR